jgi:hypothetical protein
MGAPRGDHDDLVLAPGYAQMALHEVARVPGGRSPWPEGSAGDLFGIKERLHPAKKQERPLRHRSPIEGAERDRTCESEICTPPVRSLLELLLRAGLLVVIVAGFVRCWSPASSTRSTSRSTCVVQDELPAVNRGRHREGCMDAATCSTQTPPS